jgi:hypothetical protein
MRPLSEISRSEKVARSSLHSYFEMAPRKLRGRSAARWVFTINNYCQEDEEKMLDLFQNSAVLSMCIGKEVGEQGTPHLQGYGVLFSNGTRRTVAEHL